MSESRRGFLKKLIGGAAGAVVAPLVPTVETTDMIEASETVVETVATTTNVIPQHLLGTALVMPRVMWSGAFLVTRSDDDPIL